MWFPEHLEDTPFIFENLLQKKRLKGGISIYADFGPPRYVL